MLSFENLNVYQDSLKLALDIYKFSKKFPREELFGLTSQIRRAVVSISLNIAEGSSRSKKDFRHFLDISRGSCYELVPLLKICLELKYITPKEFEEIYPRVDNLAKRINALKNSVKP